VRRVRHDWKTIRLWEMQTGECLHVVSRGITATSPAWTSAPERTDASRAREPMASPYGTLPPSLIPRSRRWKLLSEFIPRRLSGSDNQSAARLIWNHRSGDRLRQRHSALGCCGRSGCQPRELRTTNAAGTMGWSKIATPNWRRFDPEIPPHRAHPPSASQARRVWKRDESAGSTRNSNEPAVKNL